MLETEVPLYALPDHLIRNCLLGQLCIVDVVHFGAISKRIATLVSSEETWKMLYQRDLSVQTWASVRSYRREYISWVQEQRNIFASRGYTAFIMSSFVDVVSRGYEILLSQLFHHYRHFGIDPGLYVLIESAVTATKQNRLDIIDMIAAECNTLSERHVLYSRVTSIAVLWKQLDILDKMIALRLPSYVDACIVAAEQGDLEVIQKFSRANLISSACREEMIVVAAKEKHWDNVHFLLSESESSAPLLDVLLEKAISQKSLLQVQKLISKGARPQIGMDWITHRRYDVIQPLSVTNDMFRIVEYLRQCLN